MDISVYISVFSFSEVKGQSLRLLEVLQLPAGSYICCYRNTKLIKM